MAEVVGVIWVWREADYFCGRSLFDLRCRTNQCREESPFNCSPLTHEYIPSIGLAGLHKSMTHQKASQLLRIGLIINNLSALLGLHNAKVV
jgi:hypothetical protein